VIFKIIAPVLIILIAESIWAWRDYQDTIQTPAVTGNSVVIEILKGDSFNQITDKLVKQNVSIKPFWFKVIAVQTKAFKKLKTGEYELSPGITMPEILTLFVQGKTKQHAITFPEGWSFKEILKEIKNNQYLDHDSNNLSLEKLMTQVGSDTTQTPGPITSPEGNFFPDTYFFEKHTSDIALLKRAYDKMQLVVKDEWQHKAENLPFKTPYEALILASIIEKETAQINERPLIAGVFIKRLQAGMLLQTDPTVIYGMGESYQGNISYNDLKTATSYNTYIIKGLPPTPIAMPGRDAINAALHPDTSNNIYFVARGDGTHQFSATLKEHNLAVENFQRKKNDPR
jgi:UPF0755 protein